MTDHHPTKRSQGFRRTIAEHREKLLSIRPETQPLNTPRRDVWFSHDRAHNPNITIYRPEGARNPWPTIFYVPGTAFIAREFDFTEMICTRIAECSGCQVIVINHSLAPEEQFPKGLEDSCHTLNLALSNKKNAFNIDHSNVVIMGYSSGGNFAASMSKYAAEAGIAVARQVLISPLLDLSRSPSPFKKFEDKDTSISEEFVQWFLKLYLPKDVNTKLPAVSPLWQKINHKEAVPPTEFVFGEHDRCRGDAELYASLLKKAGISISTSMISCANHAFLWRQPEIVEAIGNRIKTVLGLKLVPRPISTRSSLSPLLFRVPRKVSNGRKQKLCNQPTL